MGNHNTSFFHRKIPLKPWRTPYHNYRVAEKINGKTHPGNPEPSGVKHGHDTPNRYRPCSQEKSSLAEMLRVFTKESIIHLGFRPCHAGIPWKISWRKSCLKCFLKEFLGIWEENPRFNRNGRIQACMNHVVIWVSQNGGLPNLFPCQEQLNWYTGKWNVIFTVIIQLKLNWRVSSKFLWQKIWIQIFRAALCGKKAPSGFNWDKQASVNGHIGKRLHSYATTEIKAFMLDRADR